MPSMTDAAKLVQKNLSNKGKSMIGELQESFSDDCTVSLASGTMILDKPKFMGMITNLTNSFPDFYLDQGKTSTIADVGPGVVSVTVNPSGTFTGDDFAPMPGLPKIQATQQSVVNDLQKMVFYVDQSQKIRKVKMDGVPNSGGKGFQGPVGFYLQCGGKKEDIPAAMIPKAPGPKSKNQQLIEELYGPDCKGKDIVKFFQNNLAEDFVGSFAGGKMEIPKAQFVAMMDNVTDSHPNFKLNCPMSDIKEAKPGLVTNTHFASGTHTGRTPFSPMPGMPPVNARGWECTNDMESVTGIFNDQNQMTFLSIDGLPGGRGFSGPIGFYLQSGGKMEDIPPLPNPDNIHIAHSLLGKQGYQIPIWFQNNLANDAEVVFAGGAVKMSKQEFIGMIGTVIDAFPDFQHTCPKEDVAEWGAVGTVTASIVVKGTHTGTSWAPMPGVPPMEAKGAQCQNDAEKVTMTFKYGKITRMEAEPIADQPDAKGFTGPIGFYLQIGGKAEDCNPKINMVKTLYNRPIGNDFLTFVQNNGADDMIAAFNNGAMTMPKDVFAGMVSVFVKSFPDFQFVCPENDWQETNPNIVQLKMYAKGTFDGEDFAPMPGMKPITASGNKCQNDLETMTFVFNNAGKVAAVAIDPIPGGSKFGPMSFYTQAGGAVEDIPAMPEPTNCQIFSSMLNKKGSVNRLFMDAICSEDFEVSWMNGAVRLGKQEYMGMVDSIFASIPDFSVTCPTNNVEEPEPGVVTATLVVCGTHTGAPYSPMPGVPAVPAKGTYVYNDPENVTAAMSNGKITKMVVTIDNGPEARGFSGPPGFYLQLGGKAEDLPPPPASPKVMSPTCATEVKSPAQDRKSFPTDGQ